jgi:hypothetical protein
MRLREAAIGGVFLLFSVAIIEVAGVSAQTQIAQAPAPATNPGLEAQYDAAFQEMLRQPANLDVLFKFASLATQTGDLEGAVSALERMLLINPDLPRVRLELGVLYYRLGSYEVARTYLEVALQSSSLTPEARSRAEGFMKEVASRSNPSRLSGEAFLGLRYQSSANLGPSTSSVRLFGQSANLNQSSVGTPDWGAVTSLQARHTYDLGRQDRSTIETQFTGYINRQFSVAAANVSLLDLATGPRFQAFQGTFEDVTIKPFVTAGYIWVNDTPYYGSYGGGVEGGVLLSDRLRNTTIATWRQQNSPDSTYLPTNSQFTGALYAVNTNFQFQLTPSVSFFALGSAQRFQTVNTIWQNYQLVGVGAGVGYRFPDPLFKTPLYWNINLSYIAQWWSYDAPDPTIDPTVGRQQTDGIANLTISVPFDARTTLILTGGRFLRNATLPNYEFLNNSAMVGVSWRF